MARSSKTGRRIADSAKKASKKASKKIRSSASRSRTKAKDTSSKLKTYGNLTQRRQSKKQLKARKKAERLANMPHSRIQRFFYRLHPKRMYKYWFSKEGGIMALKLAGIGFALLIVLMLGVFAYFRRDLGDPRNISYGNLTTKFYDRTGEHLLYEVYGTENRVPVEFDKISDYAKWATISIEDKDFYHHGGFSISGILRAAYNNFFNRGAVTQGGSTITQQFIKNNFLTSERTYTRKVKEIILAIELERLYSKDEILSFYLNEIPYGSQEYGIEAAAQSFFEKPAKQLTIDEAAMMAALPQAPTYYSPYGENTGELKGRQDYIISLMEDQGYISAEEAAEAKKVDTLKKLVPLDEKSLYTNIKAPHFVLEVQRQLEAEYGPSLVQTGGLKVITTLDMRLQKQAEKAVKQNMSTVIAPSTGGSGDNAALSATQNRTGHVLAQVGSRGFNYPGYGSFNAATSGRQPGSSFKPYGYAELFKNERWGADSVIYDTPTTFYDYKPNNFDFGHRGMMKVREAIGESRNIPAVKALYIAGVDKTIELAKAMGNKTLGDPDQYGLSLILGAGEVKLSEHTHGYSTFANGGIHKPQTYVLKIENAEGDILEEWKPGNGERVLDEQIAYLMTDILTDDVARSGTFGTGNPNLVVPGLTHAVKTGTTDESRDGWMMGYSKYITTGVWVGNHDNLPMNSITSWQTGPIFTQFMADAHKGKKDVPIFDEQPEGIQTVRMDANTGYAASTTSSNTYWGLFPSWYKKETSNQSQKVTIDTVSNRLATECTPDRAKKVVSGGGRWPELLPDDPLFSSWSSSAGYYSSAGTYGEKKDNVHKCSDQLPGVSLDVDDLGGGNYRFTATVSRGSHNLDTLNFKVNNTIVSSKKAKSAGTYTYDHKFASKGSKKVTAEVIDKVLYDNSSSKTINVTSVGVGSNISFISPTSGGILSSPYSFSWNTHPTANNYELCWKKPGNTWTCIQTPGTSYPNPVGLGVSLDSGASYFASITALLGSSPLDKITIQFTTN